MLEGGSSGFSPCMDTMPSGRRTTHQVDGLLEIGWLHHVLPTLTIKSYYNLAVVRQRERRERREREGVMDVESFRGEISRSLPIGHDWESTGRNTLDGAGEKNDLLPVGHGAGGDGDVHLFEEARAGAAGGAVRGDGGESVFQLRWRLDELESVSETGADAHGFQIPMTHFAEHGQTAFEAVAGLDVAELLAE